MSDLNEKIFSDLLLQKDPVESSVFGKQLADFQRQISDISRQSRKAAFEASQSMVSALASLDPEAASHAARCAKDAVQVAAALSMDAEDAEAVRHGALLHDIGKACIPKEVLTKMGELTFIEFENIKEHPYMGYKILKPVKFLQQEALFVLHHHEWWNGDGYPCHLKGSEIPLGARIISVVDAYDTMRHSQYRCETPIEAHEAAQELIEKAGTQFDPKVVEVFIHVIKSRGELKAGTYREDNLKKALKEYFSL